MSFLLIIRQAEAIKLCLQRSDTGTDRYSVMTRLSAETTALRSTAAGLGLNALVSALDKLELGTRMLLWNWEDLAREQRQFYMEQYATHAHSIGRWIEGGSPIEEGDYKL